MFQGPETSSRNCCRRACNIFPIGRAGLRIRTDRRDGLGKCNLKRLQSGDVERSLCHWIVPNGRLAGRFTDRRGRRVMIIPRCAWDRRRLGIGLRV